MILKVIDTPGFGDQLNRETCEKNILDYIAKQGEIYYASENSLEGRIKIQDPRVHVLLYFLPPTGKNRFFNIYTESTSWISLF